MVDKRDQSVTHGHRVTVGGGATVSGTLVVATTVSDAFKLTIGNAATTDALKESLTQLCAEVDKLLPSLPVQRHDEVKKDLETFVSEATKSEPRRKWYELSADGLIEAAKTCGTIAVPVITAVQKIVALLSGVPA